MRPNGATHVSRKFWRASHKAWYCHIIYPDGRQQDRRLGKDEEEAEGKRQAILQEIKKTGRPSLDCTVDQLIQAFLTYTEDNNARRTYLWYRNFLKSFSQSVATTLAVRDLELHHVQNWLTKAYPVKGNQNTRHDAIAAVKRLFNWAAREMGYLDRNPLSGLQKPPRTHRETCPTRAQWDEVLSHLGADDPFRDFVTALVDTGCRPQELRVVEARHLDLAAQPDPLIRFTDGDIPGKRFGRDVRLVPRVVEILRRLVLKHPEGPLFRNRDGNPWVKDALNCRFQRLKRSYKFPFRINCYAARHSLATDILDKGGSAGAVASLLGHRDPTVVLRFYGKHIDQRPEHLQGLLEKARNENANSYGLKVIGQPKKDAG